MASGMGRPHLTSPRFSCSRARDLYVWASRAAWRAALAGGCALALATTAGAPSGSAAVSGTVVTANIPSATTLVTTGCPPLDATRTSLGVVTPGSFAITPSDCDVLFGSSNDTATLRAYQPDNRGMAMASNATTLTATGSSNRWLDVDMATSAIGWAVGEGNSTNRLYKTTDGGNSWVAVTDANDGLDAGAEGVDAISTTVAWASRSNSNEVSLTTNGTTWNKITIEEFPLAQINKIVAADASNAWALGCELVATRCRARIWNTQNGGVDWSLAWTDNTVDSEVNEGVALSPTLVYAAASSGSGNGLVKSTNGTSFASTTPSTASFKDVDSYDGVHIAAGTTNGIVHVSADGGATWTQRTPTQDLSIRAIDYDATGVIVIGALDGSMSRSPDDGVTWAALDQDVIGGRIFALDAVGPRIFATYNASSLARSQDDGATWLLNSQSQVTNWSGIDGVDAGRMWRVGGAGFVQVSTDGGLTWAAQTSGTTELLHAVHATSRTSAVAVGTDGTIIRTADAGVTWTSVPSPLPAATLLTVTGAPSPYDDTLWAAGLNGALIRSTNRGASWSAVTAPVSASAITAVGAWNERDVMLGTSASSSRVWTTADGGTTWTARTSGSVDGITDIVAIPNSNAAVIFDDITSRRTTDKGATWSTVTVNGTAVLGADLAPDGTTIWATGEFGGAHVSTDLGLSWTTWTGGSASKMGFDALALSRTSAVMVYDGTTAKTTDIPNGVPDYDGAAASWSGTGFFGMCLRAAPGAGSTWPTDGTCDQSNGAEWRGIPLHGGLAAASVASTLAPGTTTASFRFGMKTPSAQAPGTYLAPVTFELTAPAG
ncbi:MAG: hypothetical protein JWL76_6 [Thermoleophilia bacterium]|nr:hypothetical protein [Thermoleophilia bacterium]